jgi:hypothetical protein
MAYLKEYAGKRREHRGVASGTGAPSAGTSEVQTLAVTGTPTGGNFKLQFKGQRTAAIAHNAAAAAVVAALEALSNIGSGGVTATGGALPGTDVVITFAGARAARAQPLITVVESALTGGTTPAAAVTETTPGVTATLRDAPVGSQYVRTSNGVLYTKTADPGTFVVVGAQT